MSLLLLACEIEGEEPGEWTDGAANDADGEVLDGIPDHVLPMHHAAELTLQSP